MSYGSGNKSESLSQIWASNDSVIPKTLVSDSVSFSRTGSSRNTPFANKRKNGKRRAKYVVVKEYLNEPRLLRLANPRYPLKSKKKYVYHKTYRLRYRLRKVYLPEPRYTPDSQLAVNDLVYWKDEYHQVSGGDINVTVKPISGIFPKNWFRRISGATGYLGNSFPAGWGYGSPFVFIPNSYNASSLATSFKPVIDRLRDASVRKIYSKAKDQNVNLQNVLAEIGETKSSFASIIKRVSKTILALKKGRLKQAFSTLLPTSSKDVANDVLLFNFGIKPLMSDIDGLMKHLAEDCKDSVVTTSAKSSETVVTTQTGTIPSPILYRKEILTIETKITVKTVLTFGVNLPAIKSLFQLGFTNPASTAWERIPWSFVIDWFCRVGDYIDSIDTWVLLKPISFHTTTYIEQKVLCTAFHEGSIVNSDAKYITKGGPSSWSKKLVYCSRIVSDMPPPPIPRLKSPVSTSHIVNATALLRQLL